MPSYLYQLAYSSEAWASLVKRPQNRIEAIRKSVEKLGGQVGPFWFSFGEYDVIGVLEMPDNVSAAAFSVALAAGGACKSLKTTPLLSVEEGIEVMKKAGGTGYKPATAKK
jgi:uncharacterized protein with GYD domain